MSRIKEISSVANPLIKEIRGLAQKKHRSDAGLFLAEGLKLILDAQDQGWPVRTLIVALQQISQRLTGQAVRATQAGGGQVLAVPDKVLAAIARRDNPQAVIGVFEQRLTALNAVRPVADQTWVALDRVRDPGNLGTILRTADAAGAAGVILIGQTVDPFSVETVRATMGSIFSVPLVRTQEPDFLAWAAGSGAPIIGTHLDGDIDYRAIDFRDRAIVLLMGNEQSGLTAPLASGCSTLARIPQSGRADSLNLAVATGLMLYESRRHLLTL